MPNADKVGRIDVWTPAGPEQEKRAAWAAFERANREVHQPAFDAPSRWKPEQLREFAWLSFWTGWVLRAAEESRRG